MARVTVQGSGGSQNYPRRTTVNGSNHAGLIHWLREEELRLAEMMAHELEKLTNMWSKKP